MTDWGPPGCNSPCWILWRPNRGVETLKQQTIPNTTCRFGTAFISYFICIYFRAVGFLSYFVFHGLFSSTK